jgi:hypothetical protein
MFGQFRRHHTTFLLEKLNAKIGQEEFFNQLQGTRDEVINDTLVREVNFVTLKNLTVIFTDIPYSSSLGGKL